MCENRLTERGAKSPEVSERRGAYLAFLRIDGNRMANRLNLHIDESGSQDLSEGRYIVAVVLHKHAEGVEEAIGRSGCLGCASLL